jgi:hypothetical protein
MILHSLLYIHIKVTYLNTNLTHILTQSQHNYTNNKTFIRRLEVKVAVVIVITPWVWYSWTTGLPIYKSSSLKNSCSFNYTY